MRAFTDISQSETLAKILPIESADMCYRIVAYNPNDTHVYQPYCFSGTLESDIPCWSLAALLSVYPMVVGRDMDMYCCWQNSKNLHSRHYDNPIDACVEMIIKLNELKLLCL